MRVNDASASLPVFMPAVHHELRVVMKHDLRCTNENKVLVCRGNKSTLTDLVETEFKITERVNLLVV